MVTVLWDIHGVEYLEFMSTGITINSERYCEILWKLKAEIWRVCSFLFTYSPSAWQHSIIHQCNDNWRDSAFWFHCHRLSIIQSWTESIRFSSIHKCKELLRGLLHFDSDNTVKWGCGSIIKMKNFTVMLLRNWSLIGRNLLNASMIIWNNNYTNIKKKVAESYPFWFYSNNYIHFQIKKIGSNTFQYALIEDWQFLYDWF